MTRHTTARCAVCRRPLSVPFHDGITGVDWIGECDDCFADTELSASTSERAGLMREMRRQRSVNRRSK